MGSVLRLLWHSEGLDTLYPQTGQEKQAVLIAFVMELLLYLIKGSADFLSLDRVIREDHQLGVFIVEGLNSPRLPEDHISVADIQEMKDGSAGRGAWWAPCGIPIQLQRRWKMTLEGARSEATAQ